MAALMKTAYDGYRYIFHECADPRTRDWMLMSGPVPLLTILITYNYFCRSVGPRWMKDRQPFDLKYVLIVYNAVQVVFSTWLFKEGLQLVWLRDYSYRCQPVDYSNNPVALRTADRCWWYLFCKVAELLDGACRILGHHTGIEGVTVVEADQCYDLPFVFFVLRKKNNQISHLHLWHHTLMPTVAWIGVKYVPGGHGTLFAVINTFVHIIMYSYYLLAALGSTVQKYLWWKKYLTTLQMVQFIIVFLHSSQLLIYECNYPKIVVYIQLIIAVYFLYLFGAFYRNTYRSKKDV